VQELLEERVQNVLLIIMYRPSSTVALCKADAERAIKDWKRT
jgi:hypothetical protein